MKNIITSLGMLVFVAALVAGATGAFFSDTETSTGNVFTAGSIDLKIDSQQHYNGMVCIQGQTGGFTWQYENSDQKPLPTYPVLGSACDGTWLPADLGAQKFFNFSDIKPGDEGENTISLHVNNNDAYACIDVSLVANDDVSSTEPELGAGDAPNSGSLFDGELAQNINFFAWADTGADTDFGDVNDPTEGDNIWQVGEQPLFSNNLGPASDVLDGKSYTLANGVTGPLVGGITNYVGLAWCAGTMTAAAGVITCDGAGMGNVAQTDSMVANIAFRVEQARNNPNFSCGDIPGGVTTVVRTADLETQSLVTAKQGGKWFFYNDTNDTIMTVNQFAGNSGVNDIVAGPGAEGAAQMTLDTGINPRYNIATYRYNDVKLADIGSLKYRIYDIDPSNGAPFIGFNVDFNNSDTWQRRITQVPTGLVANTWTTVDALSGMWNYSGAFWPAGGSETGTTPGTTPKSWASILADYPNAETRSTDSWLGVRVGQPGPAGDTGYVDWIEFDGETTDFEN